MMINSIVFHHTYELEHGVMSLKEPYIAAQQVLTLIHEMVKAKSKIENIHKIIRRESLNVEELFIGNEVNIEIEFWRHIVNETLKWIGS